MTYEDKSRLVIACRGCTILSFATKQPDRKVYLSVTMSSTAPSVDVCLYFLASLPSVSSATKLQIAYLLSSQEQQRLLQESITTAAVLTAKQ